MIFLKYNLNMSCVGYMYKTALWIEILKFSTIAKTFIDDVHFQ